MIDSNATSNRPPRRGRRRFHSSLLALMLLVAVLTLPIAWLVDQPHRKRRAVAATLGTGGSVVYGRQQAGIPVIPPDWLRTLLGDGYDRDVIGLDLRGLRVGDAALQAVGGLATLQHLSLWDCELNDVGPIGPHALSGIDDPYPSKFCITNSGLKHLAGLHKLRTLWLMSSHVTEDGLKHIAALRQLRKLTIALPQVGDSGLEHLKGLDQLQELDLQFTQVTDEGLARLGVLDRLEILSLWSTQVSDSGLKHLKALRRLRSLNLVNTRVTAAGAQELERALPGLEVLR
jgi:hypothetical protein